MLVELNHHLHLMKVPVENERKERLEREKALQEHIATISSSLEREKDRQRSEDNAKYYKDKYINLLRETERILWPRVASTERPRQSDRADRGKNSTPPAAGTTE
ncbi:hypothetical protein KSP39_PZI010777 [Platanthera zijinensis]|uniref:Uncharacterized protein n=1 Tax=Platanthera zijinensis TaxID=2320716 RepID=A0AAP0BJB8_9ASPA